MDLPSSYPLTGSDTFFFGLDRIMQRTVGKTNWCSLVLQLDSPIAKEELAAAMEKSELFQWICSLRLKMNGPFRLMHWASIKPAQLPEIREIAAADIDSVAISDLPMHPDMRQYSPVQFSLVNLPDKQALMFSWHHGLMDARGAETLLNSLGADLDPERAFGGSSPAFPKDWKDAVGIRTYLYEVASRHITTPAGKRERAGEQVYTTLRLSEDETRKSETTAQETGSGANATLFYLAACASVLTDLAKRKSIPLEDILVPVPQDQRKRGTPYPILPNQVAFLFYRIKADLAQSPRECVRDLAKQLMEMLRIQLPRRYAGMMNMFRWLPLSLYAVMLKAPTKGRIASFYYSDTGNSLDQLETVLGHKVTAAAHYPPNMYPSGLTFVFSRMHGKLQVTIGAMAKDYDSTQLAECREAFRSLLTGGGDSN